MKPSAKEKAEEAAKIEQARQDSIATVEAEAARIAEEEAAAAAEVARIAEEEAAAAAAAAAAAKPKTPAKPKAAPAVKAGQGRG